MDNTNSVLSYIANSMKEAIEKVLSQTQYIVKDGKIQRELVTCEHCKHWYAPALSCDKWETDGFFVDDFCSKGERK